MRFSYALALSATLLTNGAVAETVKPHPLTGIWTWIPGEEGADDPTPEKITEACRQSPIVVYEDGLVVTYELPAGSDPGEPMGVGWLGDCIILEDGVEECVSLDIATGMKASGGVWLSSYELKNGDQFSYCPIDPVTKKQGDECTDQYLCNPKLFIPDSKTGRVDVEIPSRPVFEEK